MAGVVAVCEVIVEGRVGTEGAPVAGAVVVATEGVVAAACCVAPARSQGFGGDGMLIVDVEVGELGVAEMQVKMVVKRETGCGIAGCLRPSLS